MMHTNHSSWGSGHGDLSNATNTGNTAATQDLPTKVSAMKIILKAINLKAIPEQEKWEFHWQEQCRSWHWAFQGGGPYSKLVVESIWCCTQNFPFLHMVHLPRTCFELDTVPEFQGKSSDSLGMKKAWEILNLICSQSTVVLTDAGCCGGWCSGCNHFLWIKEQCTGPVESN